MDKVAHFGMYFILVLLLVSAFRQFKKGVLQLYPKTFSTTISITYGGLIEILQQTVFEKRNMDIYDFAANCAGIITGVLLYSLIRKTRYLY